MSRPSTSNKTMLKRQLNTESYAVEKIETSVVLKHGKFRFDTPTLGSRYQNTAHLSGSETDFDQQGYHRRSLSMRPTPL